MSLGYRVFFVQGENVFRISQKQFKSLCLDKDTAASKFSNQTVLSVMVFYELENRKPKQVIRIDTEKLKFNANGYLDENHEQEGRELTAIKINNLFKELHFDGNNQLEPSKSLINDTVVDASDLFNDRRWKQRHPELPGPIMKKLLDALFKS